MKNKIFLVVIILLGIVSNIFPQQTFRKAIFLHRSVGGNVFGPNGSNTSVPAQCGSYNITHNYTGADAVSMDGVNFPWNGNSGNAWWEWHRVFDDLDPDDDIYQYIDGTDYDIIIIKTCYTVSGMTEGIGVPADTIHYDWKSQAVFRWHVRSILEIMEAHPDKFFVMWNLVPVLNDGTFSPSVVANDALFSTWMKDTLAAGLDAVYGAFPPNVYVFDIFNKIDSSNYMPTSLSVSATDNHLNATATELLAPQFVQEIFDAAFAYEMGGPETFQLSVPIQNGWNMVSVPGIHPTNQNVNTWWSGKDPAAGVFRFSGGYLPVTTTTPGQGYWMKNLGANTYNTGDEWPAGGIQIVPNVPITGATGWNLIGGFELSVLTANITTTPGGLRTGQVFGYSSGYTPATNLVPGYAYWIKLTGPGSINIPNVLAKGLAKTTEVNTSDWGKIIITDKSGKSYTLYTVKGEVNLDDYELPPAPPTGMFDVRFGSGRYAEKLSAPNQTIELNSLEYPVKVRVENADIRLQDQSGSGLNERLKSGEEVVISNSAISKLMVS
ncbi:MAG: hypothetical protein Q8M94_01570, partial [Ignavibacteria bacterium]|nr:hypothetical protein [Ignavibacteria bacterium]